jgi:hypothetical protein
MNLVVAKKFKDLADLEKTIDLQSHLICLQVSSTVGVYNVLDRVSTRVLTIGPDTHSDNAGFARIKKFMTDKKLRHMVLITRSDLFENDVLLAAKHVKADDIVYM